MSLLILELQLILFLNSCCHSIEATKTTIDSYFSLRTHNFKLFESPPPEMIESRAWTHFVGILPRKTPEGYVVTLLKLLDLKPENLDWYNGVKYGTMVISLYCHQYGPANGLILLFDMEGFGAAHLARIHLMAVKHFFDFLQAAAPVILKSIHFVHAGPATRQLVSLIKPFLKKEIADMVAIHTGPVDNIYETIPKECLPEDLGGKLPSIKELNEAHLSNSLRYLDFLSWHDTQKVDETKRTGPSKTPEYFGIDGTFRKLELD